MDGWEWSDGGVVVLGDGDVMYMEMIRSSKTRIIEIGIKIRIKQEKGNKAIGQNDQTT